MGDKQIDIPIEVDRETYEKLEETFLPYQRFTATAWGNENLYLFQGSARIIFVCKDKVNA